MPAAPARSRAVAQRGVSGLAERDRLGWGASIEIDRDEALASREIGLEAGG